MHHKPQTGFALLMTLIVVSVVISIGLTLLDLTIKQLRLSTNSKDSESAFHAANAGVECARYWRLAQKDAFEIKGTVSSPTPVSVSCFSETAVNTTVVNISSGIYKHDFQFTWNTNTRCSKVTMITFSSDTTDSTLSLANVKTHIPGYPDANKTCDPGGRCTIISVQGYNKPCSSITQIGTIQREVLLEL